MNLLIVCPVIILFTVCNSHYAEDNPFSKIPILTYWPSNDVDVSQCPSLNRLASGSPQVTTRHKYEVFNSSAIPLTCDISLRTDDCKRVKFSLNRVFDDPCLMKTYLSLSTAKGREMPGSMHPGVANKLQTLVVVGNPLQWCGAVSMQTAGLTMNTSCQNMSIFTRNDCALEITGVSLDSGVILMLDFGLQSPFNERWQTVSPPLNHVTLISFLYSAMGSDSGDDVSCDGWSSVRLYRGGRWEENIVWTTCSASSVPAAEVYEARLLYLRFTFAQNYEDRCISAELMYSFHEKSHQPSRVEDGLWNCSVPNWTAFQRHFPCDLVKDCEGGEDQARCSYYGHCGHEYLTLDGRCYKYIRNRGQYTSWLDSNLECQLQGGYLASLNTVAEWHAVGRALDMRTAMTEYVHVGLRRTSSTLPEFSYPDFVCELKTDAVTWEDDVDTSVSVRHFPVQMSVPGNNTLVISSVTCPGGHLTHVFMACDVRASCWASRGYAGPGETLLPPRTSCPVPMRSPPVMFACGDGLEHVPYSTLCDHRQHCTDGSDEGFCVFPPCSGSTPIQCAASAQCMRISDICNGIKDCRQGTDEEICQQSDDDFSSQCYIGPPAVIIFIDPSRNEDYECRKYFFFMSKLPQSARLTNGSSPCPDTHFQCSDNGFCLPVFVRCNGVSDCPGREDEADCESVSCPNWYRCRSSKICLHPSHVCDGVYHCPQRDDEVFCRLTCPEGCTCHGLAFTCRQKFRAELHTRVRYMDASRSGLTPTHFQRYSLLVHLSLSRCGLDDLNHTSVLSNLRGLDVSYNVLKKISVHHLRGLRNLRYLYLAHNPLESLFSQDTNVFSLPAVRTLDLSGVRIPRLNTQRLSSFPGLRKLNLSHCGIDYISDEGFQALSKLRTLMIVGCPVTRFPRDLFSGLDHLQTVFADNFKLCCEDTLPHGFNLASCKALFDEVSSCKSLLRSNVYVVFLSTFCNLAILGNLGCFLVRRFYLKSRASGFGVFVTHLSISDFLMGVYLAVIGVADRLYKGSYLWEDDRWRHSATCKAAGFLSLLSNEVSAFIICLVTLDRFLVLRFPFSRVRFKASSAHITCAAVWVVFTAVAAVPLSPLASHWSFYSHTGICIPLPVTRKYFSGRRYAFGVVVVFNFILFLFIAAGQAAIYVSVRANSLSTTVESTKKSTDLRIARRLFSVAVSDFLCWFPIGLLGLLASSGVPISGEVNVGLAILVLPLNSAINPFLYTVNVILERRRKSRDMKLVKQIMTQMSGEEENNLE